MMKEILITGLDGSGKSTLLTVLEKLRPGNSFDIIHLPHLHTENLQDNVDLYRTATFINNIEQYADQAHSAAIKAVAFFAAMLLYKPLVKNASKRDLSTIIVERHPLIDTGIYARFYAEKAGKESHPKNGISNLDNDFERELTYLTNLIPAHLAMDKKPEISWFLQFIHQHFFIQQKLSIHDLKKLFGVEMPEKIYYLKALPEKLFERLEGRTDFEPHETLEILNVLSIAYDNLLKGLSSLQPQLVEIVDANTFEHLNRFQDYLISEYCQ